MGRVNSRVCATCAGETAAGCRSCENCFEVERRLEKYLESFEGQRHVRSLLDAPGAVDDANVRDMRRDHKTPQEMLEEIRQAAARERPAQVPESRKRPEPVKRVKKPRSL